MHAVDSEVRLLSVALLALRLGQHSEGVQSRVLGQGHGDLLKSVSEGLYRVLLGVVDAFGVLVHS